MGFRIEGRTEIVLKHWTEFPVMTGAEVRCRSVSTAEAERFDELRGEDRRRALLDMIISWNLESPAGDPLPVTLEAIKGLEPWVETAITTEWFRQLFEPPAPLGNGSTNGASPAETNHRS